MNRITVIFTTHTETGKCNSEELYKVIESINPDVIFEELTRSLFEKIYTENQFNFDSPEITSPEIKCVMKYLQNHKIKNIPVDIDESSKLSNGQIDFMFDTFKKYQVYKKLDDELAWWTEKEGFAYLNSIKCSETMEEKRILENQLMQFVNNRDLISPIHKQFYEEQEKRENQIVSNIYNFSKANNFNQAVFLIGAAHRNSIIKKIQGYQENEKLKLEWSFTNMLAQEGFPYHMRITISPMDI